MGHYFFDWLILEARAESQKYFSLFFGSNENFEICFWDELTFNSPETEQYDTILLSRNKTVWEGKIW